MEIVVVIVIEIVVVIVIETVTRGCLTGGQESTPAVGKDSPAKQQVVAFKSKISKNPFPST